MSDAFTHGTATKRHHRVPIFSWIAWGVGTVVVIGTFFLISFWAFVLLPLFIFIGVPIPDVGPPHEWVAREWRRRQQWRTDKGRLLTPPLSQQPKNPPSKFERVEGVWGKLASPGRNAFVPALTDDDHSYLTLPLRIHGASDLWLGADHDGKFDWNMDYFNQLAHALAASRVKDLEVAFTRVHRPADVEPMLAYARRRTKTEVLTATGDTPDGLLGRDLEDRISTIYGGMAGEAREYIFVRTPWPRGWAGKMSIADPDAFRRSDVYKTLAAIETACQQLSVRTESFSPQGLQEFWDYFLDVAGAEQLHLYQQRDRELRRLHISPSEDEPTPTEEAAGEIDIQLPASIGGSKPGQPGFIRYGGTYFVAGYATEVKVSQLRPGFRRRVVLDDDCYYAFTTYIQAILREEEQKDARTKERLQMVTEDANIMEKGLSNPEAQRRMREIQDKRRRLTESSNRVAHWYHLVSIGADSLEVAVARWEDLVVQMSGFYTLERLNYSDEIEDVLLAQMAVRMNSV